MREIRFRAWDKQNNQMIVESAVLFPIIGPQLNEGVPYRWWELMQYTGLKDKNGKEIYEGDIVRFIDKTYRDEGLGDGVVVTEVKWHDRLSCFLVPPIEEHTEIIGNIHENPELLKDIS